MLVNFPHIMAKITYNDSIIEYSSSSETVLKALQKRGFEIPFSCMKGTCNVCLMKTNEEVPSKSQSGLPAHLIEKGYFKACVCTPSSDIEVKDLDEHDLVYEGFLESQEGHHVRVLLETQMEFRAGQKIKFRVGEATEYALGIVTKSFFNSPNLEIFTRAGLSGWSDGSRCYCQWVTGDCYYHENWANKNMLIIGLGDGALCLPGFLEDAFGIFDHQKHAYVYTEENNPIEEIKGLAKGQPKLHLSVLSTEPNTSKTAFFTNQIFSQHRDLTKWKVFVFGKEEEVKEIKNLALSFGAFEDDILINAVNSFEEVPYGQVGEEAYEFKDDERVEVAPDMELWEALGHGKLLNKILHDFYNKVFTDDRLSPFFAHVTQDRLEQKQYNFLFHNITGEKVYFGMSMRNAHHWMVISEELFEYRSQLLRDSIKKFNLPGHLMERWMALEESHQSKIVKSKPWHKIIDGEVLNQDHFRLTKMDFDCVCDECQKEVSAGTTIRYHERLGKIYCQECAGLISKHK